VKNHVAFFCQQIRVVDGRLGDMTTTQDIRQGAISESEFGVKVIDEDVVSQLRVTDDAGEVPRMVVNPEGNKPPLRCCLRHAGPGERIALVSYAPLRPEPTLGLTTRSGRCSFTPNRAAGRPTAAGTRRS
jgi:hypothetical protein